MTMLGGEFWTPRAVLNRDKTTTNFKNGDNSITANGNMAINEMAPACKSSEGRDCSKTTSFCGLGFFGLALSSGRSEVVTRGC